MARTYKAPRTRAARRAYLSARRPLEADEKLTHRHVLAALEEARLNILRRSWLARGVQGGVT